jgi:hypothetical protein
MARSKNGKYVGMASYYEKRDQRNQWLSELPSIRTDADRLRTRILAQTALVEIRRTYGSDVSALAEAEEKLETLQFELSKLIKKESNNA